MSCPTQIASATDVVAGPPTGGALLAHTLAGLLDSRRSLTHAPCSFAPFERKGKTPTLRPFYQHLVKGRRVLLADDVRNTGQTVAAVCGPDQGGRRHRSRRRLHLRPPRSDRRSRCAGDCAGRVPRAAELRRGRLPALQGRQADHEVLGAVRSAKCEVNGCGMGIGTSQNQHRTELLRLDSSSIACTTASTRPTLSSIPSSSCGLTRAARTARSPGSLRPPWRSGT